MSRVPSYLSGVQSVVMSLHIASAYAIHWPIGWSNWASLGFTVSGSVIMSPSRFVESTLLRGYVLI